MRGVWRVIGVPVSVDGSARRARRTAISALVALLVIDALVLVPVSWGGRPGGLLGLLAGQIAIHPLPMCELLVVEGGEAITVVSRQDDERGLRYSADAWVYSFDSSERLGVWAPTTAIRGVWVIDDMRRTGAALPKRYRDAVVAYADTTDPSVWFRGPEHVAPDDVRRALRGGGWTESRVLWWGVVHNAAVAVGCAALVWLIALEVRTAWVAMRRDGRRARGRCEFCGYDLEGAGRGAACPECGKAGETERGGAEGGAEFSPSALSRGARESGPEEG